jgi:hypothetical protein
MCLCLFVYVLVRVSVGPCLCVSVFLCLCLCVSVIVCVSVLCVSVCLGVCPCLCERPCGCTCACVCQCVFLSVCVRPCVRVSLCWNNGNFWEILRSAHPSGVRRNCVLQVLLLTVSACYKSCYLRFLCVINSVTYGIYVLHIFVTYAFIPFVPQ